MTERVLSLLLWITLVLKFTNVLSQNYSWITLSDQFLDQISDISCSNSGQYVIAATGEAALYVSNNYGASWNVPSTLGTNQYWTGVSVSANGSVMAACSYDEISVVVSTNFGVNWTIVTPSDTYSLLSIAVDGTGHNMIVSSDSQLYYSFNCGQSWTEVLSSAIYYIYMSRGGVYAVAFTQFDGIYVSSDSGANWYTLSVPLTFEFYQGTISTDGQAIAVTFYDSTTYANGVYSTTDGGITWTMSLSTDESAVYALAASASGQYVVACNFGVFYQSSNYGVNFTVGSGAPGCDVVAASSSASRVITTFDNLKTYTFNGFDNSLTNVPTSAPTGISAAPTVAVPTVMPTTPSTSYVPTLIPTTVATSQLPSETPTLVVTGSPTVQPSTLLPSLCPTAVATTQPSSDPTPIPSPNPTVLPTALLTFQPTVGPSAVPTNAPTNSSSPSMSPTSPATAVPTVTPTISPSIFPSSQPTVMSSTTSAPTITPSLATTLIPSEQPTVASTQPPSSPQPSSQPTQTIQPTSTRPTSSPTRTMAPTVLPTVVSTLTPSVSTQPPSSQQPTSQPTKTQQPSSSQPTSSPTQTMAPTVLPTVVSTLTLSVSTQPPSSQQPTSQPTKKQQPSSSQPTSSPTQTMSPTVLPSETITLAPTVATGRPSVTPTATITVSPSEAPTTVPSSPTAIPSSSQSPTLPSTDEYTWTALPSSVTFNGTSWTAAAMSSAGQYQYAAANGGSIVVSSNNGVTFNATDALELVWAHIACSSSGQYAAAVVEVGSIYLSTNFGITWSAVNLLSGEWTGVSMSGSGYVIAASGSSGVAITLNLGDDWVLAPLPNGYYDAVAVSNQGNFFAATRGFDVYLSRNGLSWNSTSDVGVELTRLTVSQSGQFIAGCTSSGGIYYSSNYGVSFNRSDLSSAIWTGIAASVSGMFVSVTSNQGYVYLSSDYGATWAAADYFTPNCSAIASNSDSSQLFVLTAHGSMLLAIDNQVPTMVPTVAPGPTHKPTEASGSTNSVNTGSKLSSEEFSTFFVVVPGAFVSVARIMLLLARGVVPSKELNILNSIYWELFESVIRGVNLAFTFNALFDAYQNNYITASGLLVVSRAVVAFVWIVFVAVLMLPVRERNFSFSNLFLYLHKQILLERVHLPLCKMSVSMRIISLFGLLNAFSDVTILRLLPWSRSEFTDRVQGYPNLFVVRSCLYGTLLSMLLQTASSFSYLARSHTLKEVLFLLVSLFNAMLAILSAVLFLQMANTSKLKAALVFDPRTEDSDEVELRHTSTKVEVESEVDVENQILAESVPADILIDAECSDAAAVDVKKRERDSFYEAALYGASVKFADQTMGILKEQLVEVGKNPLEYIPLAELKAELATIFATVNSGAEYDEARLDYLITCMNYNPEYKAQLAEEERLWRQRMDPFMEESRATMKSFIPPSIFQCSIQTLQNEYQYSKELAKRLFTKKCLWLVRVELKDIEKIHIAELQSRFNPQGQGLDIVELAAIYAAIPRSFGKDVKKEAWRVSIEKQLKDLDTERQNNKLSASRVRNPAYKNQSPLFGDRDSMHEMAIVSGDAFKARDSFKNLGKLGGSDEVEKDRIDAVQEQSVGSDGDSAVESINPMHATDTNARRGIVSGGFMTQELGRTLSARVKK